MKKKLFSLLLSLVLLGAMLSGCDLTVQLGENGPQIQIELPEETFPAFHDSGESQSPVSLDSVPAYSGKAYVPINGNQPFFTEAEITDESFEHYSELDALGRCGVTVASVGRDLMPTEKRESIREVHPTGWHSVQYDWVDGKSLYNRCHLIGFQLAGENANDRNLITGTRYLNIEGMLPFENITADYVKETGNHVMYRVTPIFKGDNLVADGVLMEGWSVEDAGQGVCFCVYAYNVQPGVTIDYKTGDSWAAQESGTGDSKTGEYILNTNSKKFHRPSCPGADKIGKKNREVYHGSRQELIHKGYTPCGSCNP